MRKSSSKTSPSRIRKCSSFDGRKSAFAIFLFLVAGLLAGVSRHDASRAESLPAWLAEAGHSDLAHLGDGSAAVMISSKTDFSVDGTGKFLQTERVALRVLNRRSAERFLQAVGYENNDTKVTSIQTWAVSPSGRMTVAAKKDAITEASYPGFELFSDDRVKRIAVPGVEDNSLVGYEIVTQGRIPVNGEMFSMEGLIPYRLSELHVSVPAGSVRWFLNHPDRVQVVSQSATDVTFRTENRPAIPDEESAPPLSTLAAMVTINYDAKGPKALQSWEDAGHDYHSLFDDGEKPSTPLSAEVDSLAAAQADELGKLNALYTFVSRQIRYVAVEIGKGGYQPHPAADVFQNKYGDCKDKANLLIAMLDKVGIRGYPALVGTRGDVEADPAAPSLATFDHMIVALPVSERLKGAVEKFPAYDPAAKILWIDPTSEVDPLGQIPEMDQGVYGLIAYPNRGDLRRIPEAGPETNVTQYSATVRLRADGTGSADVGISYLGARNTEAHSFYRGRSQADILKFFEGRIGNYVNSPQFQKASISGVEDSAQQIREQFSFQGDFSSASLGDSWFFQPLFLSGIARPEIGLRPRKLPLDFGTPRRVHGEYRFELPPGMRVDRLPAPADIKSDFGELEITYSESGNSVAALLTLTYTQSRIAPDQYAGFRDFLNLCLRAEMQRLRVAKAAS